MDSFFHNIFQIFFLLGYLVLYVVSFILLKPFRVHRHRPKSTIAIKLSYLLFLAVFLVFTYLLLFGKKELSEDDMPYDTLFNIHFLLFLSSIIVPNVGIMLRRTIKRKRVGFNVIFISVNLIYTTYLLYLIFSKTWALL
jgi:drug/metabolite transporter (DMT)-like permease